MNTLTPRPSVDLAGVDWQASWEELELRRGAPNDAAHWTKRSASYGALRYGDYERRFLELAAIEPGSRVLDFGCGVGLLSVPLAKAGCTVVACDFSEGMLEQTRAHARAAGVEDRIETRLVAWDDDWVDAGLQENGFDVAIASRSIATTHLEDALLKLDAVARRRVCVTVAAGISPRRDVRAYQAVGRTPFWVPDYAYCINLLFAHGAFPELAYIVTHRHPAFADRAEALEQLAIMMGGDLTEREQADLEAFVDAHYRVDPHAPDGRPFSADEDTPIRWAFISWGAGA